MTEFPHRFIPSARSTRTLLLLHGTGGDENDLLPLGRAIDPEAALLSPRGRVSENGANRFFRRFSATVFDEEDVLFRAQELADWLVWAVSSYGIDENELVVCGYSNGANIAAAMMLLGLAKFHRAIFWRAMVVITPARAARMAAKEVLMLGGAHDPLITPAQVTTLSRLLESNGAKVTLEMLEAGHELTAADLQTAREWLAAAAIA